MLTIDEIAKNLGVNRNTIRNLIKKGDIGAIKVGQQYRISEDNYNRFISGATINSTNLFSEIRK